RRGVHPPVEPSSADRLSMWLPASLRSSARDVLIAGARLAQEAVGSELLARDPTWATWAGLGPPAVERSGDPPPELRRRSLTLHRPAVVATGEDALERDDGGQHCVPGSDVEWSGWVAAEDTRNWFSAIRFSIGFSCTEDTPDFCATMNVRATIHAPTFVD